MTSIYRHLAADDQRARQVIADVVAALNKDRNCLILTNRTSHLEKFADLLRQAGRDPVILRGGMGAKSRAAAMGRLQSQASGPPLLVVATGSYAGEGFDCPALDTLFLAGLPETRGHPMSSSEFHHYTRDEFLAEFYPDRADKAAIAAGMEQLRAEQHAFRLAEMRRRLGVTQAEVAARMGITQGRVSAIEHAKPGTTELRTLAAYVEALGGRLEIILDFGDQRLAFAEPGTEAA
jgi:DNA-binding XRE family transcriptional regulator